MKKSKILTGYLLVLVFFLSYIFSGCSAQSEISDDNNLVNEIPKAEDKNLIGEIPELEDEELIGENPELKDKALIDEILELLDQNAKNYDFNASILIAKDGKVLLSKSFGFADYNYSNQIKNEPDTIFNIGSITKQFTAAAILLLQERGLLGTEDTIDKYITDYPDGNSIKIYNLITHTSGIKEYLPYIEEDKWDEPHTIENLIGLFKDKGLDFKPGEKYSYCSSNYILLGYIIEKTSGMKYEEFLSKNIFQPLDMNRTGFGLTEDSFDKIAKGYKRIKPEPEAATPLDMSIAYAAGALQSTTEDLFKWDQALYSNKLFKEESIKEMFTPYLENYAYGWMVTENVAEHNGAIFGFTSFIKRNMEKKYSIIMLANSDEDTISQLEVKINNLLME
ncbi:MAG: pbpE [Clostridia bacterium]|nr:pbpE [Clostridia bacterium]